MLSKVTQGFFLPGVQSPSTGNRRVLCFVTGVTFVICNMIENTARTLPVATNFSFREAVDLLFSEAVEYIKTEKMDDVWFHMIRNIEL